MSPLSARNKSRTVTIILVTAVTLLIWIWAAGETRERAVLWARVQLEPASNFSTIVSPRTAQQVALTVAGSTRSIQQIRQALDEPLVLKAGTTGIPGEKGAHMIGLVDALREQEIFYNTDVSVITTEPDTLEYQVDSLVERTVPVVPVLAGATLGGEAVADPPTVTLTLPSRIVGLVPDSNVVAEPSSGALAELEPGRRQVIQAPVRLPAELKPYQQDISIEPRSVQLAFTLILRTRSITVPAVPVQIAAPAQDLAEYEVSIMGENQFLADVVIEGAAELVTKFEQEKPPVEAFIHLTSDDLTREIAEAPVTLWELPEGLRVTSVAGSSPQPIVTLKITRRDG